MYLEINLLDSFCLMWSQMDLLIVYRYKNTHLDHRISHWNSMVKIHKYEPAAAWHGIMRYVMISAFSMQIKLPSKRYKQCSIMLQKICPLFQIRWGSNPRSQQEIWILTCKLFILMYYRNLHGMILYWDNYKYLSAACQLAAG